MQANPMGLQPWHPALCTLCRSTWVSSLMPAGIASTGLVRGPDSSFPSFPPFVPPPVLLTHRGKEVGSVWYPGLPFWGARAGQGPAPGGSHRTISDPQ